LGLHRRPPSFHPSAVPTAYDTQGQAKESQRKRRDHGPQRHFPTLYQASKSQPPPVGRPQIRLEFSSVNLYVGGNMRLLASMGMALLLLASCGDSNGLGAARTAGELCDEVCGWPDMCFAELGAEIQGDQCVDACVQQVDVVGVDCLRAIANVVSCLGTCDFESLSNDQILACQDEAEAISAACE